MTLRYCKTHFAIMASACFLALAETAFFGTAWTFLLVFGWPAWAVLTLRCMNCGPAACDHQIATHFKGIPALKKCPECREAMVPLA